MLRGLERVLAEREAGVMGNDDPRASRPLVESAVAQGRYVQVTTYRDGESPIRTQLLFRTPADAAECARVLSAARAPAPRPAGG